MTNQILQQLRSSFHYTVVDCDRQLNDRTLAALDVADRLVIVTQLNVSALRSTQRSLGIFRRLGYPNEKLCVVINRLQSGEVISVSDAVDALKTDVFFKLPNDYRTMAESMSRGVSAAEVDPQSKIAAAFKSLAIKLSGVDGKAPATRNGTAGTSRLRGLFTRKSDAPSLIDRLAGRKRPVTATGVVPTSDPSIESPAPGNGAPTAAEEMTTNALRNTGTFVKNTAIEEELSPVDQLKVDIHRRLVNRLDLEALEKIKDEAEIVAQIRLAVAEFLRGESTPLSQTEREEIVEHIVWEITGLGPIEPLFRDYSITDILVNNHKDIFIERKGKLTRYNAQFRNDAHPMAIIDRIVSRVGRRVDESSPMVDARLPDGSRVNAIIPPLSLDGPVLSIRRFGREITVKQLVEYGSMTPEMVQLLSGCVKARLNVLISGGTGSGKTTLLNGLSSFIPSDERIVTIEDAAELRLQQDHVVRLETRPPNSEGRGEVIARDLVKNALRMRPDRIVVGEVRGAEALDMLQAMNTGRNSLSTAGTPLSPRCAVEAGNDDSWRELTPQRAMRDQIASALDVVVQVQRLADGTRRVTSVVEVTGMEGDVVTTRKSSLSSQRNDTGRKDHRSVQATGIGRSSRTDSSLRASNCRADSSSEQIAVSDLFVLGLVFIGTAGVLVGAYVFLNRRALETSQAAIDRLRDAEDRAAAQASIRSIIRDARASDLPVFDRILAGKGFTAWIAEEALLAGMSLTAGNFILRSLFAAAVGYLILQLVTGYAPFALMGATVAVFLPYAHVRFKRTRRIAKFQEQLPDAIDMLVSSMKAGVLVSGRHALHR
jgi:pilus assembly protein CpaF